ncbi:glycosyltransferase family 4 protein [Candidatus Gottesmanbacteria bacterium]|nr:glycosyltransferase family 4 protein [Candidatus Gottesmanbacteria bacterium]
MIIGVDAGMLGVADNRLKVGVWRVAVELLKILGKNGDHTYRLYSFRPIDPQLLKEFGSSMKNIVLAPSIGFRKIRLPIELRLHPVDCFLALGQALPPILPKKTIGFVYDIAFLQTPQAYPDSYQKLKDQTHNLIKRSSHIITISHAVKKDLTKTYDVPDEKITVAYPGVSSIFLKKGKTMHTVRPYFLFVGSLKRGKNVSFIIKAFAQFLSMSNTHYNLLLIGSNYWKDPQITQAISRFHLESRVKLMGFIPDNELACYYRGALAFVSPSLAEGFGLPVVEAMACGCPVIVSDTAVCKEIVGDNGIFIDPSDTKKLAQAMKKMTEGPVRDSLRKKGITRSQQFSWKLFASKILSCINT